jgi:enamine deaminase RidA (YjgF/YER057c/UK114 family)
MLKKNNFTSENFQQPAAAFSRATSIQLEKTKILFISGTASVGKKRESLHSNNFAKQVKRTYQNIESLLKESGFSFSDIVNMTVYLKDIEKFYNKFNVLRDAIFEEKNILTNPPSSTCIEAKLCRPELLVEISAIALKEIK